MGAVAIEDVLFPGIDVRVTAVHVTVERVAVEASSCSRPSACPDCGCPGRRVHSRYVRRLAERPLVGRPLVISLRVRRFFCERSSCPRRTFAEQVQDLSERYRRYSVGLRRWMRAIATLRRVSWASTSSPWLWRCRRDYLGASFLPDGGGCRLRCSFLHGSGTGGTRFVGGIAAVVEEMLADGRERHGPLPFPLETLTSLGTVTPGS